LYVALTTGLRRSPQLMVCKFKAYDRNIPPTCFDLEGAAGASVADHDVTSPQPNTVVVAYEVTEDPSTSPTSWLLSRSDF
jgi:hypothetical protein